MTKIQTKKNTANISYLEDAGMVFTQDRQRDDINQRDRGMSGC